MSDWAKEADKEEQAILEKVWFLLVLKIIYLSRS